MKNKIILLAILSIIFTNIFSQEKKVEISVGAGYGYTIPKISKATSSSSLHGYNGGIYLSYNINETIGLLTGANYNRFGGVNINMSQSALKHSEGTWKQERTEVNSIDIPIRVVYSFELADDFYLQLFAGPNINYAISRATNIENYTKNTLKSEILGENIYKQPSNYKSTDLQLGAGIGVQWMGIGIKTGYDWGILNRAKLENEKFRQNDVKVTVSYKF